jgi:hypothetical protein
LLKFGWLLRFLHWVQDVVRAVERNEVPASCGLFLF